MRGRYGATPNLRGVCAVCDSEWGLRQDGTLRRHRSSAAGSWWCQGSQQRPKRTTFIPCARPGCGHEVIDQHSADADGEPCVVDGCGCQGVVYEDPAAGVVTTRT
jgi:hypothetical protein